jgi:hypothetical protein
MFTEARLKLDRANKHIADVDAVVAGLPTAYAASIEKNPETGQSFIKHALPHDGIPIRQNLGLIIGDAIHNLKTALDFSWIETIQRLAPSAMSKFAKFPVYESRKLLEDALRGREIHIASVRLYDLIVSGIQPYDGGNDSIWAIHRLDIQDKHHLLIPLINLASVKGIEFEDDAGNIVRGVSWTTQQPGPLFIPVPIHGQFHIKKKGHVAVAVVFKEGLPTEGLEVSEQLSLFARVVLQIVQLLERIAS